MVAVGIAGVAGWAGVAGIVPKGVVAGGEEMIGVVVVAASDAVGGVEVAGMAGMAGIAGVVVLTNDGVAVA